MTERSTERPESSTDRTRGCFRHWFAYYGWVRSSAPTCRRCGAPNPNYDPDRDPFRTAEKP